MKNLIVVLGLLLSACVTNDEAYRAASSWAYSMKYEVIGIECVMNTVFAPICNLHVKEVAEPISLVCWNKADGIRCHVDVSP